MPTFKHLQRNPHGALVLANGAVVMPYDVRGLSEVRKRFDCISTPRAGDNPDEHYFAVCMRADREITLYFPDAATAREAHAELVPFVGTPAPTMHQPEPVVYPGAPRPLPMFGAPVYQTPGPYFPGIHPPTMTFGSPGVGYTMVPPATDIEGMITCIGAGVPDRATLRRLIVAMHSLATNSAVMIPNTPALLAVFAGLRAFAQSGPVTIQPLLDLLTDEVPAEATVEQAVRHWVSRMMQFPSLVVAHHCRLLVALNACAQHQQVQAVLDLYNQAPTPMATVPPGVLNRPPVFDRGGAQQHHTIPLTPVRQRLDQIVEDPEVEDRVNDALGDPEQLKRVLEALHAVAALRDDQIPTHLKPAVAGLRRPGLARPERLSLMTVPLMTQEFAGRLAIDILGYYAGVSVATLPDAYKDALIDGCLTVAQTGEVAALLQLHHEMRQLGVDRG